MYSELDTLTCSGVCALPASGQLYLSAAVCGVLLTAGRDEAAWEELGSGAGAVAQLHEAGAEAAMWHSCAGTVLYHLHDLQVTAADVVIW